MIRFTRRFYFLSLAHKIKRLMAWTLLQMVDLKENIENEIHNAHDEFLKMDSHIKLYITEMEQCI